MAATSTRQRRRKSFTQPSSSSPPLQNYDVFLSFRGEDTRNNFTDHLFAALVHHGFYAFRDDKLNRGETIGPQLLKTIERSRISVIVFSRNYADSRWCLDELVKIMECKSTFQQMVLPVFYDVDPSDVRAQRGSFAKAFGRHEERYEKGKVEKWRAALTEAADFSGWHVANSHESKFIKKIVEDISNKLDLPHLHVAKYPVGIESRVQHVNVLLSLGSDDVRIIGIWGIGGGGKTTVVKALYNLIYHKFEGKSFLPDVREKSKQPNGLVGLQEQLLSDILMNENKKIRNVDQGIEFIRRRLCRRKVLIVLDDVDDSKQLDALAIKRDWFHPGSRIIVTTRDQSLLKFLEVDGEYMPELLTYNESLELFNQHAFRRDRPIEDYVKLSREVVGYAGGLPLVLEVWGSSFKVMMSVPEWKSELERLKVIPDKKIQEKLRISYDSLEDEEKNLFLDIACFFVGMDKHYTIEILKGCSLFAERGLGILSRRCLVRIDEHTLTMHDRIRDMGRDIARLECPKEPGKRSRLWFHKDIVDVLKNHTGTDVIEGLILNSAALKGVLVNAQAFSEMKKLRLLKLNYIHVSGNYEHFSKMLRWLCWIEFPLESIPSKLFMENVVAIDMCYSSLIQIWKGRKILNNLKFLYLSHSHHLIETPDFSGLMNLEVVLLNDCTSLVYVHHSIECLGKLVILDLGNCENLERVPPSIWKLASLRDLFLRGCSKLKKLSAERNPVHHPPSSAIGLIRKLDLAYCNLSDIPNEVGSLLSLENLNVEGNNFCTLPDSISHLSKLRFLRLNHCTRLAFLPKLPASLLAVVARNCPMLEVISVGLNCGTSFQRKSNESYLLIPQVSTFFGYHNLVDNFHESNFENHLENQEPSKICDLNISLPDVGLADLFECGIVSTDLSFVTPERECNIREGWALCVFYRIHRDERVTENDLHRLLPFFYTVKNKTKSLERRYKPAVHEYPAIHNDYVWLHYVPEPSLELKFEAGDEVEFSVSVVNPLFLVKKCGIRLLAENKSSAFLMLQYFTIPPRRSSPREGSSMSQNL